MLFKTGSYVDIMERGLWVGPFKVVATEGGRTTDHLILEGPSGRFEHYNDAPFNTRVSVLLYLHN
jgi:hypothetical protein